MVLNTRAANSDSMEVPLEEYTRVRSVSSNDCDWLHTFVSSDAISAGRISPQYLVRVYYNETETASTTTTQNFGTGLFALLNLQNTLASKHVRAVILCHRDSTQVDPDVLDLLWTKFKLEVSFMRHHLDYKEFRDEPGCPREIRNTLKEEEDMVDAYWTYGARWNPIRLPSETRASILRLSVGLECLSVCCRGSIVIVLIRSKAVYHYGLEEDPLPCTVDLFAATADRSSIDHEPPKDQSEFSYSVVHFYSRLLVLRCYEDYNLRHDTQPIKMSKVKGAIPQFHNFIIKMHHRRLELVKLKQNLFGYLGPLASEDNSVAVRKDSDSADDPYRRKLRSLLMDVEMLLSLYDNTIRIYESHNHESDSDYKSELAAEQLEEAKESKATAISFDKLSNLAFLYLPFNFVCALLGMNLSILGQGTVPVRVFLVLAVSFSLLTYLPIYLLPKINERRVQLCRFSCYLARRSIPAGFWFLAFCLTHNQYQNVEIMYSGLAQVFLGYTGARYKGWTDERRDDFFEKATWGTEAFWKEKVKMIFGAVEEWNSGYEGRQLTV